jgi:autoinducer 2 (AI-2) kinase
MSGRFVLGLDAGGGGGRALVLDVETGAVTTAARAWTHPPAPDAAGLGFDLDLERVWRDLTEAAREALARAGAAPDAVAGVAAASMRFGLVVVDAAGRALYAGPNRDARAVAETFALAPHAAALHAASGHWPVPVAAAPRLLWLAAKGGERWERAHALLALSDWLALRLSGELASDPSQAGESLVFDLAAGGWSWEWIDRLGLPRRLFPPLRAPGSPLGRLRPEAAEALGLRAGTPVAVGAADTQCGLLGAGALAPGALGIVAGTTAPVERVTARPVIDPDARLWSGCHALPGRFVVESNAGPAGDALAWLGGLLFPEAPEPAARLLAEAGAAPPGAGGIASSLGAEVFDARALSLPIGAIHLTHLGAPAGREARAAVARAAVEGVAFGLRANLEQILALTAEEVDVSPEIHLAGGLARSQTFARILADATGRPVALPAAADATALGAALLAAAGAGLFADAEAAARALAKSPGAVEPDPARADRHAALYAQWQVLRAARAPADGVARGAAIQSLLGAAPAAAGPAPAAVRPRILATADLDPASLARLRALGEVEYAPFRERMRLLTGAALVEALRGVQVLITEVDVVGVDALAQANDLRVVASCRGDAVNVDVEAATACGVAVLNAPGRNADAVADLALAFLLMLARKLPEAAAFLREPGGEAGDVGRMGRAFSRLRGRELWRKTVGLVGFGAVGRGVAARLAGFGARVLVFDPFVPDEAVIRANAEPVPLDRLLAESDFVSLHAPVTDATRGLLDAAALARMKPGACLVNTARAALVDEAALAEALRAGRLAGAALDVFAVEPPGADHPLLALPTVIATPHVGGNTEDVAAHQGQIVADDLARLLRGERPLHALNPEACEGFDWARPRTTLAPAELERLRRRPGPAVSDLQRKPAAARAPAEESPMPVDFDAGKAPKAPRSEPETSEVAGRLRAILANFVRRIAAPGGLERFAAGRDVTLHFALTDLREGFWFRLRDGRATAALGAPDAPADVQLKLAAEVFDGMFTGRANPMQAAMEGRLSFAGDTAKAMSLQEFQADLSRLYQEARAEVGDPGDLSALGDAPAPPGGAAAAAGDVRHEMVAVIHELYALQVITATGGNVSARIPGTDELWITPSALFKGDLRPEVMVRIDLDGNPLDEGARAPSSERLIHCAVYKTRPEARAVIHAHAPNATILVNADLPFLPVSTEAAFFDDLPRIPFVMPGTQALADAIAEGAKRSWAVLMKNHGVLVAGRSLRRAADMLEIVERSSQIILGCRMVGKEPPVLPPDVVAKLRKLGDLVA